MKLLKRIALAFVLVPLILIGIIIGYEVVGMCVNHLATARQTKQLVADLKTEVPDIEVIDVHSETGNTSGTGNHVDCLSAVIFSTEMQQSDLESRLFQHYDQEAGNCSLLQTEDGYYRVSLNTSAPFADNIEGH